MRSQSHSSAPYLYPIFISATFYTGCMIGARVDEILEEDEEVPLPCKYNKVISLKI